jgi:hypothetical protein
MGWERTPLNPCHEPASDALIDHRLSVDILGRAGVDWNGCHFCVKIRPSKHHDVGGDQLLAPAPAARELAESPSRLDGAT